MTSNDTYNNIIHRFPCSTHSFLWRCILVRTIKQSNRATIIGARYVTLRSYDAYVAQIDKDKGTLTLGPLWHYSVTTWQHVRRFITDYIESLVEWTDDDECVYSAAHGWMTKMLTARNGRAYMQTLVDNGVILVESEDTLYDRMTDDN